MAEYRIVAKVDPQTSAGAQKVKQDLRGIQTEANATSSALNKSFDQAAFDKTIGGLVNRIDQLDGKLAQVGKTSAVAGRGFDSAAGSMDRMTAAEFRAAGGLDGLNKAATGAGASGARLESTLRRVLAATDAEAAEQLRLNTLLRDAKTLRDAQLLSEEKYLAIQRQVAMAGKDQVGISGQQRIGLQQLSFQLGDVATMYSLGARPAQIFASQIGQVSQALMLLGGGSGGGLLSKVAGFLGGPWGIAFTLALTVLGPFAAKLFESNDGLDEQYDKLKKDAKASAETREAHDRWINTLDALIERQGRLADAMKDRLKVQGLADQADLQSAQNDAAKLQAQIQQQEGRLAGLRKALQEASAPIALTGGRGDEAALGQQARRISDLQAQIKTAEKDLGTLQANANNAQTRIVAGQILVGEQQGKAMVSLAAAASLWGDRYTSALRGILQKNDQLRAQTPTITAGFEAVKEAVDKAAGAKLGFQSTIEKARDLGVQLKEGRISAADYRTEMGKLAASLNKAAEAAQKAKTATDGVARFTTAKQAIGLAGRELQARGLKVSENEQFGGVTAGAHTGAGHREGRAVDVDIAGATDKAVTPPDIAKEYDALARRYAARGYIVLWAGNRYDPSGKVTPITSGDKHYGHMHLEAPATIVGKATQASGEAQARREETAEEKAANVLREKGDFVGSIVDQQNLRGLAGGNDSLQARMDRIVGDYKRRFNTETMPPEDQKKIRDALIGGDEREIQRSLDDTYVKPLQRLQALQGKTGLDRAVLNAQLEKEAEIRRALTPLEAKTIENGIRESDGLQREAQLLEQLRSPLDEYMKRLAALNALREKGQISQRAYNAQLAEMNNQAVQSAVGSMPGMQTNDGRSYEDIAAVSDENTRYAKQLADLETFRQQKLDLGVSYDELELAAAQQHQMNLMKIEQARKDVQLQSAEEIAAGVTGAMKAMFGEQSKIYKAAFAVEKAVAIARAIVAIQTGIAQASALPFPANLPAIASVVAATASIISNIQAVALNFKDGGYVRGAGGPRSDSVPANLSNGEFVVNARATASNRALLEAINEGREVRQVGRARAAETAREVARAAPVAAPIVAPQDIQVVNVSDPKAALAALQTAEGKKVLVNMIESDPNTFRQLLGTN